jgi:hypothetical protein
MLDLAIEGIGIHGSDIQFNVFRLNYNERSQPLGQTNRFPKRKTDHAGAHSFTGSATLYSVSR